MFPSVAIWLKHMSVACSENTLSDSYSDHGRPRSTAVEHGRPWSNMDRGLVLKQIQNSRQQQGGASPASSSSWDSPVAPDRQSGQSLGFGIQERSHEDIESAPRHHRPMEFRPFVTDRSCSLHQTSSMHSCKVVHATLDFPPVLKSRCDPRLNCSPKV